MSFSWRKVSLTRSGAADERRRTPQPATPRTTTRRTESVTRAERRMGRAIVTRRRGEVSAAWGGSARAGAVDRLAREEIDAVVQRMPTVSLHLEPRHGVAARLGDETFPEITVRD